MEAVAATATENMMQKKKKKLRKIKKTGVDKCTAAKKARANRPKASSNQTPQHLFASTRDMMIIEKFCAVSCPKIGEHTQNIQNYIALIYNCPTINIYKKFKFVKMTI